MGQSPKSRPAGREIPKRQRDQEGRQNSPVDCFGVGNPIKGFPMCRVAVHLAEIFCFYRVDFFAESCAQILRKILLYKNSQLLPNAALHAASGNPRRGVRVASGDLCGIAAKAPTEPAGENSREKRPTGMFFFPSCALLTLWVFRPLRGASQSFAPTPHRLLKKAGENFALAFLESREKNG